MRKGRRSLVSSLLVLGAVLGAALACAPRRGARDNRAAVVLSVPPVSNLVADEANMDERRVLSAIEHERRRRGLRPAELADDLAPLAGAARAIQEGGDAKAAFRTALERLAETESSDVVGWVIELPNLESVQVPAAFVESPEVVMALAVAAPNQASTSYIVCYVLLEGGMAPDATLGIH